MGTDLKEVLERSRGNIDPAWDDAQIELSLLGLKRRQRQRRVVRAGLGVLSILGVALASGWMARQTSEPVVAVQDASPARKTSQGEVASEADVVTVLKLPDGSIAEALGAGTELVLVDASASGVTLRLGRGQSRFAVGSAPRPGWALRVQVRDVTVEVLSARVTLDAQESAVRVWVHEGQVVVRSGNKTRVVEASGSEWFPTFDEAEGPAALVTPPVRETTPTASAVSTSKRLRREALWKQEAHQGRYDRAFKALGKAAPNERPRGLDELLLASDAARLSGHPEESVPYLNQVIRERPRDPRAPLAAFTLGRVFLNELGQPIRAAEAFARVRQLEPDGALAEDALAREVEAWSKGNRFELARQRAQEYLQRYPNGRRVGAVRVFGGVEE